MPRWAAADATLTTDPERRASMPGTTARHISIVPIKLRLISARTSSILISSALFGFGLPPAAAMSPPAALTRIVPGPSARSTSIAIAGTRASSLMSPRTTQVRPPMLATSACDAARSANSPNSAGACSSRSCTATLAPSSASRFATACPKPRPDPVTSATCPFNEYSSVVTLSPAVKERLFFRVSCAQRLDVLDTAPDLRQLVVHDLCWRRATLPGRLIRVVFTDAAAAQASKRRAQLRRRARTITLPPLWREQPDVPRLERARLDRRGQRIVLRSEDAPQLGERHGAVADGAAHQPVALRGELRAVVLQVHVANAVRGAAREGDGIFADGERIASVEHDA